jgi:hypothetical protein
VSLAERLIALEHEGWDALVAGEGGRYYREHLTDDALMAFPFGVLTRAATIEAMESAPARTGRSPSTSSRRRREAQTSSRDSSRSSSCSTRRMTSLEISLLLRSPTSAARWAA